MSGDIFSEFSFSCSLLCGTDFFNIYLEVPVSYLVDEGSYPAKKSVIVASLIISVLGVFAHYQWAALLGV
jgi:hypothetical protein